VVCKPYDPHLGRRLPRRAEAEKAEQERRLTANAQAALDAAHADFAAHRQALEQRAEAAETAAERAVAELAAEGAAHAQDREQLQAMHAAKVAELQERIEYVDRPSPCWWGQSHLMVRHRMSGRARGSLCSELERKNADLEVRLADALAQCALLATASGVAESPFISLHEERPSAASLRDLQAPSPPVSPASSATSARRPPTTPLSQRGATLAARALWPAHIAAGASTSGFLSDQSPPPKALDTSWLLNTSFGASPIRPLRVAEGAQRAADMSASWAGLEPLADHGKDAEAAPASADATTADASAATATAEGAPPAAAESPSLAGGHEPSVQAGEVLPAAPEPSAPPAPEDTGVVSEAAVVDDSAREVVPEPAAPPALTEHLDGPVPLEHAHIEPEPAREGPTPLEHTDIEPEPVGEGPTPLEHVEHADIKPEPHEPAGQEARPPPPAEESNVMGAASPAKATGTTAPIVSTPSATEDDQDAEDWHELLVATAEKPNRRHAAPPAPAAAPGRGATRAGEFEWLDWTDEDEGEGDAAESVGERLPSAEDDTNPSWLRSPSTVQPSPFDHIRFSDSAAPVRAALVSYLADESDADWAATEVDHADGGAPHDEEATPKPSPSRRPQAVRAAASPPRIDDASVVTAVGWGLDDTIAGADASQFFATPRSSPERARSGTGSTVASTEALLAADDITALRARLAEVPMAALSPAAPPAHRLAGAAAELPRHEAADGGAVSPPRSSRGSPQAAPRTPAKAAGTPSKTASPPTSETIGPRTPPRRSPEATGAGADEASSSPSFVTPRTPRLLAAAKQAHSPLGIVDAVAPNLNTPPRDAAVPLQLHSSRALPSLIRTNTSLIGLRGLQPHRTASVALAPPGLAGQWLSHAASGGAAAATTASAALDIAPSPPRPHPPPASDSLAAPARRPPPPASDSHGEPAFSRSGGPVPPLSDVLYGFLAPKTEAGLAAAAPSPLSALQDEPIDVDGDEGGDDHPEALPQGGDDASISVVSDAADATWLSDWRRRPEIDEASWAGSVQDTSAWEDAPAEGDLLDEGGDELGDGAADAGRDNTPRADGPQDRTPVNVTPGTAAGPPPAARRLYF